MTIQFQQYRHHHRKAHERRATRRNKRQRNAHNGPNAHRHANIYEKMKEENTCYAICIDSHKIGALSFGNLNDAEQKHQKDGHNAKNTDKTLLFADGTENEIRLLFGNEIEFGHCAFQKSLALKTAWTDGHFWVIEVVSGPAWVHFVGIEPDIDAVAVVFFQDIIEQKTRAEGQWAANKQGKTRQNDQFEATTAAVNGQINQDANQE